MSPAAALAARAAGVVAALGYLTGVVDGPVVAVVGCLALITFGRALGATADGIVLLGAAFAVLAGASGVVALRWGTLDLAALRGIQGVLGPTLLVEPLELAIAASVAVAGGIGALGVWLAVPVPSGARGRLWRWAESGTIALSLAAFFAGPQITGVREGLVWVAAGAVAMGGAEGIATLLAARSLRVRGGVLAVAGLFTLAGAGVAGVLA